MSKRKTAKEKYKIRISITFLLFLLKKVAQV